MAYDGIFIKYQIAEILNVVKNEHISKIAEGTSKDVSFFLHKNGKNYKLTLNANANFPHMLLTDENINNMKTPTGFCMLLRKYLNGGIIKNIHQIGKDTTLDNPNNSTNSYERIIKFDIENISENGNKNFYYVFFEVMGKYSNIIITDENLVILDVLLKGNIENARLKQKNVYNITNIANKYEIEDETAAHFITIINKEKAISKINNETFDMSSAIIKNYAGLSKPYIMSSLIDFYNFKKNIKKEIQSLNTSNNLLSTDINDDDSSEVANTINSDYASGNYFNYASFEKYFIDENSYNTFLNILKDNLNHFPMPCINYKNEKPSDFYFYKLNQFEGRIITFTSLNNLIKNYVDEKFLTINDSNEKSVLNETIKKLYAKLNKKIVIYNDDLSKSEDYEKYKNYAELISAFAYDNKNIIGENLICNDYNHNNKEITISLDTTLSVAKNVEKYYNKFNKLKRTRENALKLIKETEDKLSHLDSIKSSIEFTNDKNDLYLIKKELVDFFDETKSIGNFNREQNTSKKSFSKINSSKKKSNQLNYNIHHYKSSSGIDIYVGKNNLQNEYLTFTLANPNDTWLHIKDSTGSHVIIKGSYENIDEKTLIEGASLAAYYSDKRNETKATVDYTLRKELKKVKGKAPGFCIYHKNFSINVNPAVLLKEI